MKALSIISNIKGMRRVDSNSTVNLQPNYMHLIQNYFSGGGVWNKRAGATKLNTGGALDGSVASIKQVRWDDGHTEYLIAAGTRWYKTYDFVTNTVIKSYLPTGYATIDVDQFKITTGHVMIANPYVIPQKYDNITLSKLSTGLPNAGGSYSAIAFNSTTVRTMAKDSTNTYMYAGGDGGALYKVRISDGLLIGTITTGLTGSICVVIDSTDTNLYVLAADSPAKVAKIRLSDFTYLSTKTLDTGVNAGEKMAIDSTNTYLYIISNTSPTKVCRLTLADFTTTSVLTFATGENLGADIVVNTTHAYVACGTSPSKIVRVLLSDFATMATKALTVNLAECLTIDATYLYIGTEDGVSATVTRLTLADFTTTAVNDLSPSNAWALVIIGYDLFVGCDAAIAKIDLNNFTTAAEVTTVTVHANVYSLKNIGSGVIWGGVGTSSGGIIKINIYSQARYIESHRSKTWVFGFDGDTYRLYAYFSKTGDASDFTTANDAGYLNFGTVLSIYDTPTGMKSWGQYIVFFFTSNILIYSAGTDPNDFQLVKHIKNVGSLSNEVLQVGDDLWFPTLWGIRSLKLASVMEDLPFSQVSQDIDNFWVDNITTYATNTDRISMVYDKIHELILILANASNSQGVSFYVYSIGDKAWSVYKIHGLGTGVDVTAICVAQSGLVYIGTSDGNIYEMYNGTTDNTVAIDYIIEPVIQFFGNPIAYKKIKYIKICTTDDITGGTVYYTVDNNGVIRNVSVT